MNGRKVSFGMFWRAFWNVTSRSMLLLHLLPGLRFPQRLADAEHHMSWDAGTHQQIAAFCNFPWDKMAFRCFWHLSCSRSIWLVKTGNFESNLDFDENVGPPTCQHESPFETCHGRRVFPKNAGNLTQHVLSEHVFSLVFQAAKHPSYMVAPGSQGSSNHLREPWPLWSQAWQVQEITPLQFRISWQAKKNSAQHSNWNDWALNHYCPIYLSAAKTKQPTARPLQQWHPQTSRSGKVFESFR